jgi:PAS domain S-box-containing protein
MPNSTFDRWFLGAGGLLALLILAGILTFLNTRQFNEDARWVAHTHEVRDALEEVGGQLREAEAVQRTYIITGGDTIPADFMASINASRETLGWVKELTEDNGEQQARIPDIDRRIEELARAWSYTMTVRKEQGFDAARQIVASGEARHMLADVQGRLRQMDGTERDLLRNRSRKREKTYRWAIGTGLLSGVAAVLGVVAFATLLRRHLAARTAAAAIIAEQRERLRTTLASIGDAVISTDTDSRITGMNPVAEALTGWTLAEARGQPLDLVFRIINEETRQTVKSPARRALTEGVIVGLANHTLLVARDGTERPIDDSAAPIRCARGETVGCVLVFRDVAERRRQERELREQERLFRTLAESIPQLAWMAHPNGDVFWYNRRWYEYTGTTFEQMQGWGWQSIHDPNELPKVLEQWKASIATGEPFDMVFPLRGKDAMFRLFLTRAVPLRDEEGRLIRWFGTSTDVTEARQAEERERHLLAEADRRKDEFLATLAHELRNPLAPIRNALQIIRLSPDRPARERARSMMERQLEQLVRLVDDLLDVNRINRGKLELRKEHVLLSAAVHSAVETSRPMIEHMDHELTVALPDQPIVVDADLTRLSQVFSNLLNNSAKYMDRGGHIRLSAERDGNDVVVSVKDTGIGISAEHLSRIFEMFSQVNDSLERSQGGLGIGLTLVRRLVEMHGGRIEARSDGLGCGAEFLVRLPIVEDSGPPAIQEKDEPAPLKSSLRILLVDDNRDSANSLAMLLQVMGNDTRTAYDGQQGVDVAEEFRPDVVLLDIGLPKLNGHAACRHIREQEWGKSTVLIAVTGWGQEEDRRRSQEAGFDYHMVKPVDPQDLMKLLAGLQQARS